MITAVIGSRSFNNYDFLEENLDTFDITEIVSGGAKGADSLAERYAKENDLPMKIFPPDWETHGKQAAFIRNKEIIDYAEIVIAFWDGKSTGTKHSIDIANKQGKQVYIF